MHLATLPDDAVAFGRHAADLPGATPLDLTAYPRPSPMGPTPRTIREHVGKREIGSFGTWLAEPDPTARRLRDVVRRARAVDDLARRPVSAAPRLIAMREAAEARADRAMRNAMIMVAAALALWVGVPTALALIAGVL
ncbi:hypothetical protein LPN01_09585 [Sphingomonas sp. A2-49]|uniref:hypothetical protein n=1 Tax=Sphingomonas sp. A2-49 TaxID=1391375 RepID=UPI0021CE1774|nr:hypothetical protein [Sphingomonas sp. A2-49]MCU6454330.1 hypothetical protein [Sphingomonas sp. A2-49]